MSKNKSGFMLLELLAVLAIIMFIAFKVFNLYFKQPSINKEMQKIIAEQGIDATSHKSTIDSTRAKFQDIQDKHFDDLSKIE